MGRGVGSGKGRPFGPIKHGTNYAYKIRKCKCADCYAAHLEYWDKNTKKIKQYSLLEQVKRLPEHPLKKKVKGE